MNAYDIAKDLDREGKFPGHICYGTSPLLVRAANMLRQQADRIERKRELIREQTALLVKQNNRIAELEKETHSINYTCPNCETHVELFYKTPQIKELSDEEIIEIGNAVVNLIDSNEGWIEFAKAILKKASEK